MNKFVVFAIAIVAGCALVAQAGRIENPQELEGAKKAFSNNLNFFANLIKNSQEEAQKQLTVKHTFKNARNKFQNLIDTNKDAPIPKPSNEEAEVYLHDKTNVNLEKDNISTTETKSGALEQQV